MSEHGITQDLIHEFIAHGHNVYLVSSLERGSGKETSLSIESGCHVLRVKIGKNKQANLIEKGLTTILLPYIYIIHIVKFFSGIKFDLVLYPTPPITHYQTARFIKNRDGAKTYLLLKDIFPQNAIDLGMMSTTGPKSIIYHYFRRKEKKLYAVSDQIGCMSPANVRYVLDHNPEVEFSKVEVCPNAIEIIDKSIDGITRNSIRNKYGIPLDKKVFIYGGNLGKPQSIPFLIDCLKAQHNDDAYFLIVGDGTEFGKLEKYVNDYRPSNVKLMKRLPKEDYDDMVAACDVGMIFLDFHFTIPNFPSRLLSYMQAKIPVIALIDEISDLGEVISCGNFGWYRTSNNSNNFCEVVNQAIHELEFINREEEFNYLRQNYNVKKAYEIIVSHM